MAACCFEQADRPHLYTQLLDLSRTHSTYMCVRVSASSSKKRIKRIMKGSPVYENYDLAAVLLKRRKSQLVFPCNAVQPPCVPKGQGSLARH